MIPGIDESNHCGPEIAAVGDDDIAPTAVFAEGLTDLIVLAIGCIVRASHDEKSSIAATVLTFAELSKSSAV